MEKLLEYINRLTKPERMAFFQRCETTEGYIRKAVCIGQTLSADLCIAIDRESGGILSCESLRTETDWQYLREKYSAKKQKRRRS